ncbi:MAG TPA: hypothetical protein VHB68_04345 [Steroidobacteraceae bacterium]|nr:hypothetical protein [Steroidobacteraceae bacterium]
MRSTIRLVVGSLMLGMYFITSGCIVAEPREGYYDRDHHRWYHEHAWRACEEHDAHCH